MHKTRILCSLLVELSYFLHILTLTSMDTPPDILPACELFGRGTTKFAGIIDLPLIVYGDELIKHHDLILFDHQEILGGVEMGQPLSFNLNNKLTTVPRWNK
jgi:hypothetical protein